MKKTFLLLLLFSTLATSAQDKKPAMPSEGFWVIENNVKTPKQSTVFFYNQDQTLIYKETISGKRLNVNRKKVVRRLNNALTQSLIAWNKEQVFRQNLQIVWNRH